MSGHSKWSTIKRQKGIADAARGQVFTKLAKGIVLAVKNGGGSDPMMNFKLRLAVDRAKMANMPKENIERAIARASGAEAGAMEEVLYEAFLPGGASVMIEGVTDKKQRTVAEVKNIVEKGGGTFGVPGSVAYMFSRIGEVIVPKKDHVVEDIVNMVLDAGVEDFDEDDEALYLYVQPDQLMTVKKVLEDNTIEVEDASIIWKPHMPFQVENEEQKTKAIELMTKIEDNDDVQKVYTNLDY